MLLQLVEPDQTPFPHESDKPRAIGIDLGTTHSLVAVSRQGKPGVLCDESDSALLPSIVFREDHQITVGEEAREKGFAQPERMMSSFKRAMGQSHSAERAPHDERGSGLDIAPVEASAEILKALKRRAEKHLGYGVSQAVITVPAYFNDAARTATRDAARLAGLEVLRLVNEPTAAALAYGLEHGAQGIYAVYDLGGGTFDLSLLNLEGEVFKVLATAGDTRLGGDDMDYALLAALSGSRSCLPSEKRLALIQARQIKEYLTDHEEWSGVIRWGNDFIKGRMTRVDFECVISPLVDKTLKICKQAIRDAQIRLDQIKGIVLVGGATRVPLVFQKVRQFFGQEPLTNINPDEVVALGAALQAEALTQGSTRLLLDVTPLSLGLEIYGGLVEKIIPRNSPIPASHSQDFTTFQDNQTAMSLHIVQGERELVQDCRSLANFTLRSIPSQRAGTARVRVTFTIDADGILTVSACEQATGLQQSIEVKPGYGLTEDDLLNMLKAGHFHAHADIEERLLREARTEAEHFIHTVEEALKCDSGELLEKEERSEINLILNELRDSLQTSRREEILGKINQLKKVTAKEFRKSERI
ncbi:MAG: Fe-S protein assembly chaperone HscA [Caedimonas sp.]|nr:Fe-S protein assembly chaperone HscA [Caedimonas sp.]